MLTLYRTSLGWMSMSSRITSTEYESITHPDPVHGYDPNPRISLQHSTAIEVMTVVQSGAQCPLGRAQGTNCLAPVCLPHAAPACSCVHKHDQPRVKAGVRGGWVCSSLSLISHLQSDLIMCLAEHNGSAPVFQQNPGEW